MHKTTVIENRRTLGFNSGKEPATTSSQRRSFRYILAFLPFALILLISTSYQKNPGIPAVQGTYYPPEIRNSINAFLQSKVTDSTEIFHNQLVNTLYSSNHFAPLWTYHGLDEKGEELVYLIEHAREYGLEPENYGISQIKNRLRQISADAQNKNALPFDVELEVMLSRAALRIMINLHAGYRNPDSVLYSEPWIATLPELIIKGVNTGKIYQAVLSVEPRFIDYQNLRKATQLFVRSRTLSDEVSEIQYPGKDTVLLMDEIKEALISLGYLSLNHQGTVRNALENFQKLHGLAADGKPGINTIEALRKSTLYRYRILALNLDRLRKKDPSDTSMLYVNIPAYQLKIYDGNKMTDTFRVIVGNPSTPTPLISGDLQTIIANPYWYVPRNIAVNEILPKIKEDSNYLDRNGFRILDRNFKQVDISNMNLDSKDFEYTFRQNRGSDNSLGQIKFLFSNPYAIYLHDTPGKQLFQKDIRAFSHGCVRVEHPGELAAQILTSMDTDTAGFHEIMKNGQEHAYEVTRPLKVQITYITSEADVNGQIFFYKDIYGLDAKEMLALGI